MRAKVSILRLSPEIRYHQNMSRVHADATATVHSEFHTKAGRYSSKLYDDPWTARVGAVAQRIRLRILAQTIDGLTTSDMLPEVQTVWAKAQGELADAVNQVRANWREVISAAQSRLGGTFDWGNYPSDGSTWDVTARLAVHSAEVPADLSASTCQGLKDEAEAALREELIQGQQRAIEEVKELVARVATSKRAEKTRKAGIRRISRLRRINLLDDPAYDAVCSEAIRELQGGAAAPTHDIDFVNPFGS